MSAGLERRVVFDFEIDFSNGGGLQGQGFRLDLDSGDSDIDEAALAECIVRDLRLLMVGEVRILRKRVIEEPHKRRVTAAPELS
ncbi:cyclase [Novilysobacter erysipheiresistens]|uniref:Cyclase n=1 Tax=Novilysobacter erysipheiresistens TaxID=1749332 RepID=A0ABU7YXC7_9GAMM